MMRGWSRRGDRCRDSERLRLSSDIRAAGRDTWQVETDSQNASEMHTKHCVLEQILDPLRFAKWKGNIKRDARPTQAGTPLAWSNEASESGV